MAEGNPFFLEELLAGLHDRALATPESDVPDSVQAVLATRIDLLPPVEKAALQAAAVMGRVFWRGAVRELLEGESPDFAVLEARDFIRRRSGPSLAGEREFAFKHALTREVAYASVPRARRAQLHARFAAWVERVAGARDEHAPYLAHHYAEAVRPQDADLAWADRPEELARLRGEAVAWLRRAGELAAARYELDEAIALYERALELEESVAARVELWRALGPCERPQVRRGRDVEGHAERDRPHVRSGRSRPTSTASWRGRPRAAPGCGVVCPTTRRWTSGSRPRSASRRRGARPVRGRSWRRASGIPSRHFAGPRGERDRRAAW